MKIYFIYIILLLLPSHYFGQKSIDRKAVVSRHKITVKRLDTLASLSVGNGQFCFTTDFTGLQSFPDYYKNGIPLATQSDWAWHTYPNDSNYIIDDVLKPYAVNGRQVNYAVQSSGSERGTAAVKYLRQNPHRMQLAHLGILIINDKGEEVNIESYAPISQHLDLWNGELHSRFAVEGEDVDVVTYFHQNSDQIGIKIKSNLITQNKLRLTIRLPYPTYDWTDEGANWANSELHKSAITFTNKTSGQITHILDDLSLSYHFRWNKVNGELKAYSPHRFIFIPSHDEGGELEFVAHYGKGNSITTVPQKLSFESIKKNNQNSWPKFWKSGGSIDFIGSSDPRANELERRIILSQYLTKIQCTGLLPPQETGLTYNSWYGKPHLEMYWWHVMHFIQWGRYDLVKKGMLWYKEVLPEAINLAKRQGYRGARWQKMTDPRGKETPSSVGSFLIWQQPHIIYLAEQAYQNAIDKRKILSEYSNLVDLTAEFMASYPSYDSLRQRYILGPALMPAQERYDVKTTINPTFELAYWHYGLQLAQTWRKRMGHLPNIKYQHVIDHLSLLPMQDGIYLPTESTADGYTNPKYLTDHPSVLGALGFLPATRVVDSTIMKNTLEKIIEVWHWQDTWGWDFPLVAMTAARLDLPDQAIDALMMPIQTNTYLVNGHNYQDGRLRLYLPGNGGLLSAVAMMCEVNAFPKNGRWKVRWEGVRSL